jgi:hypothetical protein
MLAVAAYAPLFLIFTQTVTIKASDGLTKHKRIISAWAIRSQRRLFLLTAGLTRHHKPQLIQSRAFEQFPTADGGTGDGDFRPCAGVNSRGFQVCPHPLEFEINIAVVVRHRRPLALNRQADKSACRIAFKRHAGFSAPRGAPPQSRRPDKRLKDHFKRLSGIKPVVANTHNTWYADR